MVGEEKARVLLVDDQPARLLSYEAILDGLELDLVKALSGYDALKCLMQHEFALILLDVNMPDMDGFETASLIHQHPRHERTPIIFVTGIHVTDMDRVRGYSLGAFDYVYVPVVPEILRTKVTVLAELHRRRQELQRVNSELGAANARLADANRLLHDEKTRELRILNEGLERANGELRRMMEQLQASDRRKDEFLAILGHELRNPLAPLHTATEILRRPDLPESRRVELRDLIERQVLHLTRLVDDLLDLSRVTRDVIELRHERLSVESLIARAAELSRPMIDRRGQGLEIEVAGSDLELDADPVRMAQVLANLLNNASKFSGDQTAIRVRAWREGVEAIVTVKDQGIGIPPDMLECIFDPFVRVDLPGFGGQGGLGIGLALARKIAALHGGRIEARSEGLHAGAEFELRLPLRLSARSAPQEKVDATGGTRRGHRIVVADDNRDAAESMAFLLRLEGHVVDLAYDGVEAVRLVRETGADIALLDLGMPELDGLGAAEQIRALPDGGRPLLIAVTGWGQDSDRSRTAAAGFDGHCVKPVSLDRLRLLLDKVRPPRAGTGAVACEERPARQTP